MCQCSALPAFDQVNIVEKPYAINSRVQERCEVTHGQKPCIMFDLSNRQALQAASVILAVPQTHLVHCAVICMPALWCFQACPPAGQCKACEQYMQDMQGQRSEWLQTLSQLLLSKQHLQTSDLAAVSANSNHTGTLHVSAPKVDTLW